jgi:hypothetical protein
VRAVMLHGFYCRCGSLCCVHLHTPPDAMPMVLFNFLRWSPGVFVAAQASWIVCISAVYCRVVPTKGSGHKQVCRCSLTVGSVVAVWGGCMAAGGLHLAFCSVRLATAAVKREEIWGTV